MTKTSKLYRLTSEGAKLTRGTVEQSAHLIAQILAAAGVESIPHVMQLAYSELNEAIFDYAENHE